MPSRFHLAWVFSTFLTATALFADTAPPVVNGSLSVDQAVGVALNASPLLKGQTAAVAAAEARLHQAIAATRLTASTTTHLTTGDGVNMVQGPAAVEPMDMEMIGPGATYNQNLSVLYPLYTGGRLKRQVTAADAALKATQSDQETVRQDIILATRVAYHRAVWTEALVGVYEALEKDVRERLRVDQEQFDAGKIPRVNVIRDESDVADAEQKLTDVKRDRDIAVVDLKTVMGVDQKSNFTFSDQLASLPGPAPTENAVGTALKSRPELQSVERQLEAAQQRVEVARSAYRPQVNAVGASDFRAQRGLPSGVGVTVGIVASLPLLDGGLRRADVAEAQAMLEKVQRDRDQVELTITQQVQTALLQVTSATQNVTTAQAAIAAAEEDYRLAQLRYTSGKGINLEPLDALFALVRARTNRVQALFEQNVAVDNLARALGTIGAK